MNRFRCSLLELFILTSTATALGSERTIKDQINIPEINQDTINFREQAAIFIGSIYYLSNPLFELNDYAQFNKFLEGLSENSNLEDLFTSNGPLIALFRKVGNRMVETGIRSYRPQDSNWAYGRALEMGADMDQARKISSEINQGSLDIYSFGLELIWLANVLPEYVAGNEDSFFTTGTFVRQSVREMILPLRMLGAEYITEYLKPFGPYMVYETAIMIYNYLGD